MMTHPPHLVRYPLNRLNLNQAEWVEQDLPLELREIERTSLAELHRLSITLSNLFDVAPTIINGTIAVPTTSETKAGTPTGTTSSSSLSVLKGSPFWIWDQQQHTQEQLGLTANAVSTTGFHSQKGPSSTSNV